MGLLGSGVPTNNPAPQWTRTDAKINGRAGGFRPAPPQNFPQLNNHN
jgi:hypothetical protein